MTKFRIAFVQQSKERNIARFDGRLRVPYETDEGISVVVDVADDTLRITAVNGSLGAWPREQVRISALDDGFHLRVEGEEVILSVDKDAEFAVAMGIRSAPPLLRRKIASLMHPDVAEVEQSHFGSP